MRKIKTSHKNLMIIEASYIYCKRHNLNYNTFIDDVFMTEGFDSGENSEFDDMCKDLRMYRRIKDYKLKTLTIIEYELCVDKYGE